MIDEWLLMHLAKFTTLSCVLIVIYFLVYSIFRISQMPNNPWNWNEWQWPIGGRHAVEIYRKPTEMPFILSPDDSTTGKIGECTFTVSYLKEKAPPEVTVMWGPAVAYLMRLINLPWNEFNTEIMRQELQPGEWKSLINSVSGGSSGHDTETSWRDYANFFILQKVKLRMEEKVKDEIERSTSHHNEAFTSTKFNLAPPVDFDWSLLKDQFRYPAAIFITGSSSALVEEVYEINGILQIVHVKNEVFCNPSTVLAKYVKMNNGQSHILQSLYVMDDHRVEDLEDNNCAANNADPVHSSINVPHTPFNDILCSVCQVSPVSRVIIPCRHVCLCTQCFEKVEICPICRGHILYYFRTRQESCSPNFIGNNNVQISPDESQDFTWWQRVERFNERFNGAMGLIRQY